MDMEQTDRRPTWVAPAARILGALVALLVGAGVLLSGVQAQQQVLRVGATPVPHAEVLEQVKPVLAAEGIDLRIVEFTDYVQPNLALDAGDLDANYFQHIPYLEQFSKDHGLDLTYIAAVHIEPMGLYSRKVSSIEDLPGGARIGIPNDPTNGGRALLLLQSAGLIKLDPAAGITATPLDVVENPHRLRFQELEAAQLPRVLFDVEAAVINTNYALEAGLNPTRDALVIEGSDSPYVNVLAVRTQEKDAQALQALARALTSDAVRSFLLEKYGGAVVPAF
ncbi:methionine ABC transporter substrate-binding protein [Limnochorda pilosa]|uniref:Lipoprotein n=2 Tax=Limnochorda pilosa TaxID=1555112 RepID=A0A0K2SQE1_LIMPI|nr:methionine ABC transporter substrate-binding protein [Limnochorda pilosa]